ncbi:hypothetical protein [Luteimonas cucumeris]|uniref:hypothetical protein n=1 Tax=Luteimonas cucumeris TaxID=985012 RepID=UPI0011A327E9|nr:hypothetical protein [Luteimonas cucumeris]
MTTTLLLLVLPIGFFVLALLFIVAVWTAPRRAKWLGLATIAAAAPFFFWLGAFSEQFGAGQCYSNAIGMIANAVEQTDSPSDLAEKLRALPLHGYETSCPQVEAAARQLPNVGAP